MPFAASRLIPLRLLAVRALWTYPALRALIAVVAAFTVTATGREEAAFESPVGVVIIAMLVGAIDVRRRGESLLWGNLGYSAFVPPAVFGLVAVLGELLLATVRA